MAPAPQRLAVDLSSNVIRALEGTMGGAMRCGAAAVPDGAMHGGRIKDPGAVGGALKQLLARTEITESKAMVAVSDTIATFKILRLPVTATDGDIGAAAAHELPQDPERLSTDWIDLGMSGDARTVYVVAWEKALVRKTTEAVQLAGLDPMVVDLKSACVARATVEPSCILLDLTADPAEMVLVDRHVPQVWHSFPLPVPAPDDSAPLMAGHVRSMLRFYRRTVGGEFGKGVPVLVSGEQILPSPLLGQLADLVDQPVRPLPAPPRVPSHVRHPTFLACLGLIMRRAG